MNQTHTYIIAASERPRVEALVTSLNAFVNSVSLTDCIAVLAQDERVAGSLDVLLAPIAIKIFDAKVELPAPEPEKPEKKTRRGGRPVEKSKEAICRRCKKGYKMVKSEKLCPDCAGKPRPTRGKLPTADSVRSSFTIASRTKPEWTVLATGERITHAEMSARLGERRFDIGARLDHDDKGSYTVDQNGHEKLTLHKVLE